MIANSQSFGSEHAIRHAENTEGKGTALSAVTVKLFFAPLALSQRPLRFKILKCPPRLGGFTRPAARQKKHNYETNHRNHPHQRHR